MHSEISKCRISGSERRGDQCAESDQEIARRAMKDGKCFVAKWFCPDRIKRQLKDFPNKMTDCAAAKIYLQGTEPVR